MESRFLSGDRLFFCLPVSLCSCLKRAFYFLNYMSPVWFMGQLYRPCGRLAVNKSCFRPGAPGNHVKVMLIQDER